MGQTHDALLRREHALSEQYTNAETMLDAKVKAMEARMRQEQTLAMANIDRQAEAWKEQVRMDVHHQQNLVTDGQTSG